MSLLQKYGKSEKHDKKDKHDKHDKSAPTAPSVDSLAASLKNVRFEPHSKSYVFRVDDAPVRVLGVLTKVGYQIVPSGSGGNIESRSGAIWTLYRHTPAFQQGWSGHGFAHAPAYPGVELDKMAGV